MSSIAANMLDVVSKFEKRLHLRRFIHTPDEVEKLLREDVNSADSRLRSDTRFKYAVKFYRRIAQRCNHSLINDLIYVSTTKTTPSNATITRMTFEEKASTSQSFKKILDEARTDSQGLRICAISASPRGHRSAFGFLQVAWLTISRRNEAGNKILQSILAWILENHWAVDTAEKDNVVEVLLQHKLVEQYELPDQPTLEHIRSIDRWDPWPIIRPLLDLNFEELDKEFYLEWRWQRDTPNFSDSEVFIWQPHLERPPCEHLRLLALSCTDPNSMKLIAATSSPALLDRIVANGVFPDATGSDTVALNDVKTQLIKMLNGIYGLIRLDALYFISRATISIQDINCRARTSPREWKIQLLQHYEDYFRELARNYEDNATILETLTTQMISTIPQPSVYEDALSSGYLRDLINQRDDLETIIKEFRQRADLIVPMKAEIKDRMEYSHSFRNIVIGLILTIYVPISFACSIFGMSVVDNSDSTFDTNTTSSKHFQDLALNENQTFARVSTNQQGTVAFKPLTIGLTAGLITLITIVLPLAGGYCYRSVARFAHTHQAWWRVIIVFLALSVLVGLDSTFYGADDMFSQGLGILNACETGILLFFCWWHFVIACTLRPIRRAMLCWWLTILALSFIFNLVPWFSLPVVNLVPYAAVFVLWFWRDNYFFTLSGYLQERRHQQKRTN